MHQCNAFSAGMDVCRIRTGRVDFPRSRPPEAQKSRLSAGFCFEFADVASAAAIATVLAALTSLLAALAGILGLLAGLLTATLLLAGALLPALLLLTIATLLLTGVLWILAHVYTPVAQPLTGEGAGQSLRRLERLSLKFPMPGRLTAVKRVNVVGIRMVPDNIRRYFHMVSIAPHHASIVSQ